MDRTEHDNKILDLYFGGFVISMLLADLFKTYSITILYCNVFLFHNIYRAIDGYPLIDIIC